MYTVRCVQQLVYYATIQHPQAVSAVQFHPTYQHVFVSGCLDNRIRIWDTSKNRVLNFKDTRDPVTTARFSKDGEYINAIVSSTTEGAATAMH
jgi:WD40 repeat protein